MSGLMIDFQEKLSMDVDFSSWQNTFRSVIAGDIDQC